MFNAYECFHKNFHCTTVQRLMISFYNLKNRYELSFATNVLGTYTLTELMLPLLEKAAPDARVITVSSGGMFTSPLTTDLQVKKISQFLNTLILLENLLSDKPYCSLVVTRLMGWYSMLGTREFR